ncbi:biopolymer transporter ExbD [Bacteroidia bacterium]|nr:biopolymer transporter ExbD [Bacteroidia bacterium]
MSEINTDSGHGGGKKGQPKKMNLRVDFTPMVDMNMLLITFFMFCTSLSKPQVMELVLPVKDDQVLNDDEKNKVKDSKAITLILGAKDKVYYYLGKIDKEKYANWQSLKETNYAPTGGVRDVLAERNAETVKEIVKLKQQRLKKEITEDAFKEAVSTLKNDPNGLVVVIKPSDESSYKNMVDVLDEMQICGIGKYALIEMSEGDNYLLKNYLSQGEYASGAAAPNK